MGLVPLVIFLQERITFPKMKCLLLWSHMMPIAFVFYDKSAYNKQFFLPSAESKKEHKVVLFLYLIAKIRSQSIDMMFNSHLGVRINLWYTTVFIANLAILQRCISWKILLTKETE